MTLKKPSGPQPASHPRHRSARWQQTFFPFRADLTTGGGGGGEGGGANRKFFPLEVDPPLDETLVPHRGRGGEAEKTTFSIFQCSPRATTQVRPANHAGCTLQFHRPHYNANFWTLGGPHFMASRATFGPRAALFTSLI